MFKSLAFFALDKPLTKVDVTNFILNLSRQGDNFVEGITKGTTVITGSYKLAATYCEPDNGPGDEIQIMTHGIGFDRSYWDMSYNAYNYSYVAKAVDQHKYSTLTWDRLGIGASSKGHPIDEIQVFLEIAALKELTQKARKGLLPGINAQYSKAVHIGHSFGSVISLALANTAPELTDAIVLTGFAQTATYLSLFAVSNNFIPVKESLNAINYPAGYVATASTVSVHMNFFAEGNFDPQMLRLAYKTAQPTTPGELLTLAGPMLEENSYTGSVLVVTGDRDVPFCGGNCMATGGVDSELASLLDTSKKYFPHASQLNTTVIPGTGHGMNLEYTCGQTYDAIFDFLSE